MNISKEYLLQAIVPKLLLANSFSLIVCQQRTCLFKNLSKEAKTKQNKQNLALRIFLVSKQRNSISTSAALEPSSHLMSLSGNPSMAHP